MAEVISIVVFDEIALCWDFTRRPVVIVRRRFCTMYLKRKSLHRDVIRKVVAFTADRVEREGWIERTLGVSSSEADGKTYGIK